MHINTYSHTIKELPSDGILVCTTNPEGRHGLGVAKVGRDLYGAKYGQARGPMGRCYGIVTKNLTRNLQVEENGIIRVYSASGARSIHLHVIWEEILEFYHYATCNPDKRFYVPYTFSAGTSLSGYNGYEMAAVFLSLPPPDNVLFHVSITKLPPPDMTAGSMENSTCYSFWKEVNPLSNFYAHQFVWNGMFWYNSEQAIMWAKANAMGDEVIAGAIRAAVAHPSLYKSMGRKVSNFDKAKWMAWLRYNLPDILKAKFEAPWMRAALLSTDSKELVEGSPSDDRFGAGMHYSDVIRGNEWHGANIQGKNLVKVRESLKVVLL